MKVREVLYGSDTSIRKAWGVIKAQQEFIEDLMNENRELQGKIPGGTAGKGTA